MNGAVSRARLGINRWLARAPLFGYYFAPVWGTIPLMARPRKTAVFLKSDFQREFESISLQRRVCLSRDFIFLGKNPGFPRGFPGCVPGAVGERAAGTPIRKVATGGVIGCQTRIVASHYLPHHEWCDATPPSLSSTSRRPRLQRPRRVDSAVDSGRGPEPQRRFDAMMALGTGTVPRIRSWS
jgi:hypothetical protein